MFAFARLDSANPMIIGQQIHERAVSSSSAPLPSRISRGSELLGPSSAPSIALLAHDRWKYQSSYMDRILR
jgi:hypothetical protein